MAIEIERKFLLLNEEWRAQVSLRTLFRQGYLCTDPTRVVRVRVVGAEAYLTVKGITTDISRAEWQFDIPLEEANEMLAICQQPLIEKYRHLIWISKDDEDEDEVCWEIDEFLGENAGLIVAEIELQSVEQSYERPSWLGQEVSGDKRYSNSNLVRAPFSTW
jgi:adenylate cyclase